MRITLVTGGARSGKSRYAERLALRLGAGDVTFIATATASDEEMARRIARHRDCRPADWQTIEAPMDAATAVRDAPTRVVLLDCLTLLAANALRAAPDDGEAATREAVLAETRRLLDAAHQRDGILIIVTNEVGSGIVPATPIGRWFRDAMGEANQTVAAAADEVVFVVCGIAMKIKG